jgi:pyridoxamine 5'-phosphate oxidase
MNLVNFIDNAMKHIQRGVVDRKSFFRHPVLASTDGPNIFQRIVVMREFDFEKKSIVIFTDSKSQKVGQILKYPECSLLFWDPRKKLQISVQSKSYVEIENLHYLSKINDRQQKDFTVNPPPKSEIKAHDDYEFGDQNRFTVINLAFKSMDVLQLSEQGHIRATHDFENNTQSWVSP